MSDPDYGTYQQIEDLDETEVWEQQKNPPPDTTDHEPLDDNE